MSKYFETLLSAAVAIIALAAATIISGISTIDAALPILAIAGVVLALVVYFSNWYTRKKAEMYR